MKTYVLTVSQYFPATHPRKGETTGFIDKILDGIKIHTIRENFQLWKRRAEEINAGRAVLSVRVWSGKPYRSSQVEVVEFSSIGIQCLERTELGWFIDGYDSDITVITLAKNDGLNIHDFKDWFKGKWETTKAIIHFTDFRYK